LVGRSVYEQAEIGKFEELADNARLEALPVQGSLDESFDPRESCKSGSRALLPRF
jgi:hypothetical protein